MIANNFEYLVPSSLGEAVSLLSKHGGGARILAGGQSLVPMMKLRLASPQVLIDIGRLHELAYVKVDGNAVRIGALTTHHAIASSSEIARHCAALADAAALIGDVQVRNKGTLGGSLAHADPAADYPASILALDATITALGPGGERSIPANQFFVDMLTTALLPDEIVREIRVPIAEGRSASAYLKFAQKASGFAICGVAAVVGMADSGNLSRVSVGVTGVAGRAFRASSTEEALLGRKPDSAMLAQGAAKAARGVTALDDIHASAEYRLDLARIFTRRAMERALERCPQFPP